MQVNRESELDEEEFLDEEDDSEFLSRKEKEIRLKKKESQPIPTEKIIQKQEQQNPIIQEVEVTLSLLNQKLNWIIQEIQLSKQKNS